MTEPQQDTAPTPPGASPWDTAQPAVQAYRPLFAFGHLPAGPMRDASALCSHLAEQMVAMIPSTPQLTHGLQALWEAKNCFVVSVVIDRANPTTPMISTSGEAQQAPVGADE